MCLADCPVHLLTLTLALWCARKITALEDAPFRRKQDRSTWIIENQKQRPTDTCGSEPRVTWSFRNYQTYHDFSPMPGTEFLMGPNLHTTKLIDVRAYGNYDNITEREKENPN